MVNRIKVREVFLYVDNYTILHTSTLIYQNIIETLEREGIKVNFRVALGNKNTLQSSNGIQEKIA